MEPNRFAMIASDATNRQYWRRIEVEHALASIKASQDQTRDVVRAGMAMQYQALSQLAEGQRQVFRGVVDVERAIYDLAVVTAAGFQKLANVFESGISDIVSSLGEISSQIDDLKGLLKTPLTTEADELRERGEAALAEAIRSTGVDRKKWLDDAMSDFVSASKKNRYDATVHFNIGYIHLANGDVTAAKSLFEDAARYAIMKSSDFTGYALRHLALSHYLDGEMPEAVKRIREATQLLPGDAEVWFEAARYHARMDRVLHMKHCLKMAIGKDRANYLRAAVESDLGSHATAVEALLKELAAHATERASSELAAAVKFTKRCRRFVPFLPVNEQAHISRRFPESHLDQLRGMVVKAGYLESRSAWEGSRTYVRARATQYQASAEEALRVRHGELAEHDSALESLRQALNTVESCKTRAQKFYIVVWTCVAVVILTIMVSPCVAILAGIGACIVIISSWDMEAVIAVGDESREQESLRIATRREAKALQMADHARSAIPHLEKLHGAATSALLLVGNAQPGSVLDD